MKLYDFFVYNMILSSLFCIKKYERYILKKLIVYEIFYTLFKVYKFIV